MLVFFVLIFCVFFFFLLGSTLPPTQIIIKSYFEILTTRYTYLDIKMTIIPFFFGKRNLIKYIKFNLYTMLLLKNFCYNVTKLQLMRNLFFIALEILYCFNTFMVCFELHLVEFFSNPEILIWLKQSLTFHNADIFSVEVWRS